MPSALFLNKYKEIVMSNITLLTYCRFRDADFWILASVRYRFSPLRKHCYWKSLWSEWPDRLGDVKGNVGKRGLENTFFFHLLSFTWSVLLRTDDLVCQGQSERKFGYIRDSVLWVFSAPQAFPSLGMSHIGGFDRKDIVNRWLMAFWSLFLLLGIIPWLKSRDLWCFSLST